MDTKINHLRTTVEAELKQLDEIVNREALHVLYPYFNGVWYHVTTEDRLASIKENGLMLSQVRNSEGGVIFGTYLTDDPAYLMECNQTFEGTPYVIAVDLTSLSQHVRIDVEFLDGSEETVGEFVGNFIEGATVRAVYCTVDIPADLINFTPELSSDFDEDEMQ